MKLTKLRSRRLHRIWPQIVEHYGPSKFQKCAPVLNLYYDPDGTWTEFGKWDNPGGLPEVSVNVFLCRNMREVVEIQIHEYIHHLQSPVWYTRYDRKYGYWDNPYELAAVRISQADTYLFLPVGHTKSA